MCLLVVAIDPLPGVRFVMAANRDEAHERTTAPAHVWPAAPEVTAGLDLRAGGTWMGVTSAGRLAAITNVRDPSARREGRSRGDLPRRFLTGAGDASFQASAIAEIAASYPAFNLFAGDSDRAFYITEAGAPRELEAGIYGVSNARLDVPWPKLRSAKTAMREAVARAGRVEVEALFAMLRDETPVPDAELPSTGVPLEVERLLATPFIRNERYGTRASTVAIVFREGPPFFEERSFGPDGGPKVTEGHSVRRFGSPPAGFALG